MSDSLSRMSDKPSDELAFTASSMRRLVASLVGVDARPLNKGDFHGSILIAVESASEASNLRDTADLEWVDDFVSKTYEGVVRGESYCT